MNSPNTDIHLTTDPAAAVAAIDNVEVRLLEVPLGSARGGSGATRLQVVHVTLCDTDGATGTGFSYALGVGGVAVAAMLDEALTPQLIGLAPQDWDKALSRFRAATNRLGRGVAYPALSAVDIAIWDLRALRSNQPLHRLLGSHRDTVPIYGSGRATHQMTIDELVAGSATYIDEGYNAVKLRVGAHSITEDVQRVTAVREALGAAPQIMIDCNERLRAADARTLAWQLRDAGISWLEEPLPAADVTGHINLAAASPIPLAGGEHLLGRHEFAEYLRNGALSVAQPDAALTGGITETMKIVTLAETFGATIAPHFLPELHVHIAAATEAPALIEHFPLIDDLLLDTLHPVDGVVTCPTAPGHGIAWNPDALDHYDTRARA